MTSNKVHAVNVNYRSILIAQAMRIRETGCGLQEMQRLVDEANKGPLFVIIVAQGWLHLFSDYTVVEMGEGNGGIAFLE